MVHYKLTYFNARARGEVIRMIFAIAEVEYEDVRVEEVLPSLKSNLAGKTDLDQLQADMIVDCIEDGLTPFLPSIYESDETKKAEMRKKYSEEQLPAAYASLEKILKSNKGGDGFFVGDELTWADLAFHVFVSWAKAGGIEAVLDKYPKLKALEKRVGSVPKVAAWIAKRPVTEY